MERQARWHMEMQAEMLGITDDADAYAELALNLAIYFKDGDLDKYLNMPYVQALELANKLNEIVKEAKRKGVSNGIN